MTTHTSFFPKLTDRVAQSLRFSIIKENQLEMSKPIAVIRTVTQIRDRNERKTRFRKQYTVSENAIAFPVLFCQRGESAF